MQLIEITSLCFLIFSAVTISNAKKKDGDYLENDLGEFVNSSLLAQGLFVDHDPMDEVNGEEVVEGDILLPKGIKFNDWTSGTVRLKISVNFWKDGVVYYMFDTGGDKKVQQIIRQAIKNWERVSCLKFEKCKDIYKTCINITTIAKSCSSHIGSIPNGQHLYLGKGCHTINIATHEIGHSIGFFHEQSRLDRDSYIQVNADNIKPEKHKQFFKIMDHWGTEYDYTSIMHYHSKSFSRDRFSLNSMISYNPHYQTIMGKSKDLSFRDKFRVNKMYQCSAKCPNKEVLCQNGGYLSPYKNDGKPCRCMCPPRIKGQLCEYKPNAYQYYDLPACSINVTRPTVIQTPGYPRRNRPPEKCSYWIQAPIGKTIMVHFEDFSFSPRADGPAGKNQCYFERVEIRHIDFYNGKVYCAEDLKGRTLKTSSRFFVIIIDAEENAYGRKGLKANVNFV